MSQQLTVSSGQTVSAQPAAAGDQLTITVQGVKTGGGVSPNYSAGVSKLLSAISNPVQVIVSGAPGQITLLWTSPANQPSWAVVNLPGAPAIPLPPHLWPIPMPQKPPQQQPPNPGVNPQPKQQPPGPPSPLPIPPFPNHPLPYPFPVHLPQPPPVGVPHPPPTGVPGPPPAPPAASSGMSAAATTALIVAGVAAAALVTYGVIRSQRAAPAAPASRRALDNPVVPAYSDIDGVRVYVHQTALPWGGRGWAANLDMITRDLKAYGRTHREAVAGARRDIRAWRAGHWRRA